MRIILLTPFLALAAAGCVPRAAPPPVVAPQPVPTPTPTPAPTLAGDWRDWPLTPGDWHYRATATGGVSTFGTAGAAPIVTLACDRAARSLTLTRSGAPAGGTMTLITTSRTTSVTGTADGRDGTMVRFAAGDPMLDAMGYSRGRFVLQQQGLPTLVIPAWPEIERVTEDCRG